MNAIVQQEMVILRELADGAKFAIDVGCFVGTSSIAIARGIVPEGRLVAIDTFEGTSGGEETVNVSQLDQLRDILGHFHDLDIQCSVIIGRCEEVVLFIEDEVADFVFLDASHNYTAVKRDIEQWYKKVKPGGILAGHDFECPASQCNQEYLLAHCEEDYTDEGGDGKHYGVIRAVCEIFGDDVDYAMRIWWKKV